MRSLCGRGVVVGRFSPGRLSQTLYIVPANTSPLVSSRPLETAVSCGGCSMPRVALDFAIRPGVPNGRKAAAAAACTAATAAARSCSWIGVRQNPTRHGVTWAQQAVLDARRCTGGHRLHSKTVQSMEEASANNWSLRSVRTENQLSFEAIFLRRTARHLWKACFGKPSSDKRRSLDREGLMAPC